MKKLIYLLSVFVIVLVVGCEDYVNKVDPLIDRVEDARLTQESQISFQITGVQQSFSVIASESAFMSDLLSDMMEYTGDNPSASFPTFEEINVGYITLQNTSSTGTFNRLHAFRFLADTLLARAGQVNFTSVALKDQALFTANFYGAIARFWLATIYADTENKPGTPVNGSAFIPATQLLDDAIAKAKASLNSTAGWTATMYTGAGFTNEAYAKKVVNSMIAKMYLAKLDYANATTHALLGLAKGDQNFNALNSSVSQIYHWGFGGAGRVQAHVATKYNTYVTTDPKEAARVKLSSFKGKSGATYYYQNKYPNNTDAFPVMTWKENSLMLAELALRGQAAAGNALALVNDVRASYSIDPLASINLDGIYVERDKELFVQGARLLDQNRFGKWHLAADTWHYLPVPRTERETNPNF